MDSFLAIGAALFVVMLVISLLLRGKLERGGGMNTYGLIMVAFVITALCVGCFYDMPGAEFSVGIADWTTVIATSPEDGTSNAGILGRILLTLGIGMVIGLCVALIRYARGSKNEGVSDFQVDE